MSKVSLDDLLDAEFQAPEPETKPNPQVGVGPGQTPAGNPTFAERVAPPTKDTSLGFGPGKLALAGAGSVYNRIWQGVQGNPAPDDSMLLNNSAARWGATGAHGLNSMLGGVTAPGQMAYGAVEGALQPGSAMERGVNALKGAATSGLGQLAASTIIKGANAGLGNYSRAGEIERAAHAQGLDLSAGDMIPGPMGKALQIGERNTPFSPTKGQGAQVAELMTAPTGDPISNGVRNAYEAAQVKVSDAASQLDNILAASPNAPKLVPRETVNLLREIKARHPETFNNIDDAVLRDKIQTMVGTNPGQIPKGMTFTELDEIRRAIGPVVAKIQKQAQSPSSNITTTTANRWNGLYKSILDDMEKWGTKSQVTADALDAHNLMKETFKNEVLPLRSNPVSGKILNDGYARPEELLRDLTSGRNKSIVNDLYGRLDQGGKNAFDALRMAQRGTDEFVKGSASQPAWVRPLETAGITAALLSPAVVPGAMGAITAAAPYAIPAIAAEQGLVHGLNTGLGKAVVGGSPLATRNPFLNSALYATGRQSAQQSGLGALQALQNRETPQ